MKGWVFLGDAHLNPYHKDDTWEKFMALTEDPPEGLCLMGDFFDFFFGFKDRTYLEALYRDIAPAFWRLKERGTRVLYLEGNHDFCLPPVVFDLPLEVYSFEATLVLSGLKFYLAHGDRFSWLPQRVPSLLLKNPIARFFLRGIGPKVVVPVAFFWARHSRGRPSDGGLRERLRSLAEGKIKEGFDVVVLAHTHVAEVVHFHLGQRRGVYYNVGSFREGKFLLFSEGRFSLQEF